MLPMERPLTNDSSLQPRVNARLACAALLATPASVPAFAFLVLPTSFRAFLGRNLFPNVAS